MTPSRGSGPARRLPLAARAAQAWSRLGPRYLPFADAASDGLPWPRLLRLSLFKLTMGLTTALMVGTLNRVMIFELGIAAWLVALMLALPLLVAPLRAFTGFQSDTHRSAFGWRRVPYMWAGTLVQFFGLAIMPFALLVLSGGGTVPVAGWVGPFAAALAFLLVGIGLQTSQTAGLALATDQASAETRPRVVALMYTMLLVGAVAGGLLFSAVLAEFTPTRLVQLVQGVAVGVLALNCVALWKQEARDPERARANKAAPPAPPFRSVWHAFIANPRARRFLWASGLGFFAFNMQDVVLEPYGGEVLRLAVAETSALTALMAGGALAGFWIASRALARGHTPLLLAAWGAVLGLPAFSFVILAAPMEAPFMFRTGAALIGAGGGLFAVGTLLEAMELEGGGESTNGGAGFVGMALGAFGAVQAAATGLAIFAGGLLHDAAAALAARGALGEALVSPATGYGAVYHLEMLLLMAALVVLGPLVRRRAVPRAAQPVALGLPQLPN
jgi:BCD family chlorophyll transporter-like MFS transporter